MSSVVGDRMERTLSFLPTCGSTNRVPGLGGQEQMFPTCVMAGTGIGWGQSHLLILGGADESNFFKVDELRDKHPGFPRPGLGIPHHH